VSRDRNASSQPSPDAGDIGAGPTGDVWHNERLMSDPIGADVGPLPSIDGAPGEPADEAGAIDGQPGRYERQDDEDAAARLGLAPVAFGKSND
jgi:hypothetical protein